MDDIGWGATVYGLARSLVGCLVEGNSQECCGGRGAGSGSKKMRDICLPTYHPTQIVQLEEQRQHLGLALMGQFVMVTFRVVTGNVGGAAIGALVFIVGNQARCSLQASALTSFVILGYTLGSLDAVELIRHLASDHFDFFQLPFNEHVILDLNAMQLILAPFIEVTGARLAWDSYLTPSMMFLPQPSATQALSFHPSYRRQPGYAPPLQLDFPQAENWFSVMGGGSQDWLPDYMPGEQQAQWRDNDWDVHLDGGHQPVNLRYRRRSGASSSAPTSAGPLSPAPRGQNEETGKATNRSSSWWPFSTSTESTAGDTGGPPCTSGKEEQYYDEDDTQICSGCSEPFGSGYGRKGTGAFRSEVYCRACWDAWRP
jgi:hypothetical protein